MLINDFLPDYDFTVWNFTIAQQDQETACLTTETRIYCLGLANACFATLLSRLVSTWGMLTLMICISRVSNYIEQIRQMKRP